MMRTPLALLAVLQPAAAAAGPLAAAPLREILLGTLRDANDTPPLPDGYAVCGLSTRLLPATGQVIDQGPAVSLWRRDLAAGPITLTLPSLGRAVVPYGAAAAGPHGGPAAGAHGGAAAWTYYAAGTAQLYFTTPTTGSLVFVGHAVAVNTARLMPRFDQFATAWDAASSQLSVRFTLRYGDCALPVVAVYHA